MTTCLFESCAQPSVTGKLKCERHARKGSCTFPDCKKQAYQRRRCVEHGGRKAPCSVADCTSQSVRVSGLCAHHAATLPSTTCGHQGCKKTARGAPNCVRHTPKHDTSVRRISCGHGDYDSSKARRKLERELVATKLGACQPTELPDTEDLFTTLDMNGLSEHLRSKQAACSVEALYAFGLAIGSIEDFDLM